MSNSIFDEAWDVGANKGHLLFVIGNGTPDRHPLIADFEQDGPANNGDIARARLASAAPEMWRLLNDVVQYVQGAEFEKRFADIEMKVLGS